VIDEPSSKPLIWIGSSRKDLREFPEDVQHRMGYALWIAQTGGKHRDAKALSGFGGAGVLEVIEDYRGDTFRAVYTLKYADVVFMLHAFQKKSKRGTLGVRSIITAQATIRYLVTRLRSRASSTGAQFAPLW
jgi:phage-related protein